MRLFDLHCDTVTECYQQEKQLRCNDLHISLERGRCYSRWAQLFAVWMPDELRGQEAIDYFDRVSGCFYEQAAENPDWMAACRTAKEMHEAFKAHRCAAILSVEGGSALAGDPSRVAVLYDRGVRLMTLTWNGPNELADGCMTPRAGGLTAAGRLAVAEMERLGMVVDVSHLSRPGFYEVADLTEKPFVATHSNCDAVFPHPRSLTDDQLRLLIRRGGLVGMNLYTQFLGNPPDVGMDAVYRHICHLLSLGGERAIALGCDYDGSEVAPALAGIEKLACLWEYLLQKGLPEAVLNCCFYQNSADFFNRVLQV